ncbi:MAG: phosphatase PAP2 family protein, partial [Candidatus Latescibacterota bacterium]
IGGAAALAVAGAAAVEGRSRDMTLGEIEALSRSEINGFDRGAAYNYSETARTASNVLIAAIVAAPLALAADDRARSDWRTVSAMYLETIAFAAAVPSYAKASFARIRPQVYNPDAPMDVRTSDEPRCSFFSRHASIAFASAVFLSTVHDAYRPHSGARPFVWAASLLAAASVGAARCEAGKHFPTDVIAGAVVGSAAGWLVPRAHRAGGGLTALAPLAPGGGMGVTFELRF